MDNWRHTVLLVWFILILSINSLAFFVNLIKGIVTTDSKNLLNCIMYMIGLLVISFVFYCFVTL
jgi:hypothetical protein